MLVSLLLLAALAHGAPPGAGYYVEGPPSRSRTDALAVVHEATSRGWSARVTRRYELATGWWWVPRVEGFEAQGVATEAARDLAARTGWSLAVYAVAAGAEPGPAPAPTPRPPAELAQGDETSAQVMARATAAHGGLAGGAGAVEAAEAVLFRFRRTLDDGTVVEHTWARRGDALYLHVEPASGRAVPSRTVVSGDEAWLQVGDDPPTAQVPDRARAAIARFGPREVLSFPLGFAVAASRRPELELVHLAGEVEVDGVRCRLLAYDGGHGGSRLELAVAADTGWVREVRIGDQGGVVAHAFSDYRVVAPGVVVPGRVRTWHGPAVVDDLDVLELDLAPRLPDDWFDDPVGR